ncbi:unnamed protein product [Scytosiphon promiscuus]
MARLFQGLDAADQIMSSPGPHEHKLIGRGVRNFDYATWDCVREDAAVAGTFAIFTQKPSMEQHRLSTGSKVSAEARPLYTV